MITEINEHEYESLDHTPPMLIEFYSKTCGPCKMLAFVLKDIAKQKPDFPIYIIDFDENRELKERLGVKGFTVDQGAVLGLQILDEVATLNAEYLKMPPGNRLIGDPDIISWRPPDKDDLFVNVKLLAARWSF